MADQEYKPLTYEDLARLDSTSERFYADLFARAAAEIRHLRAQASTDDSIMNAAADEIRGLREDKQMMLDDSRELEICKAELEADNARLREAINKDWNHAIGCPRKPGHADKCTCGLDAALANMP